MYFFAFNKISTKLFFKTTKILHNCFKAQGFHAIKTGYRRRTSSLELNSASVVRA